MFEASECSNSQTTPGSEDGASVAPSGMAGTEDHWDVGDPACC